MYTDVRYCESCGGPLSSREVEGRERPWCARCDRVTYLNPKVAAAVVAARADKVVLVRRGTEPARGRWAFPSGYVDRGEEVQAAAAREFKEETGLDVGPMRLLGVYSTAGNPVVLVVYATEVAGGNPRPGSDVVDVALFSLDRLPPMPFPHDDGILRDWRLLQAQEGRSGAGTVTGPTGPRGRSTSEPA